MTILQTELWLTADLESVWEFHANPQNLEKITPSFLKTKLQNVPEKIEVGSSFQIVSENPLLKSFFSWSVQYIEWTEQADYKAFVDIQQQGPFALWKHKHEFKRGNTQLLIDEKTFKAKSPGTWVCDTLEFELKPALKSFEWVAMKILRQLFIYRKQKLIELFPYPNDN